MPLHDDVFFFFTIIFAITLATPYALRQRRQLVASPLATPCHCDAFASAVGH